jgi:hypothetical protein
MVETNVGPVAAAGAGSSLAGSAESECSCFRPIRGTVSRSMRAGGILQRREGRLGRDAQNAGEYAAGREGVAPAVGWKDLAGA